MARSLKQPCEGSITTHILQMRKLRLRTFKWLCLGHTLGKVRELGFKFPFAWPQNLCPTLPSTAKQLKSLWAFPVPKNPEWLTECYLGFSSSFGPNTNPRVLTWAAH